MTYTFWSYVVFCVSTRIYFWLDAIYSNFDTASYADNNSPHSKGHNTKSVMEKLEKLM